MMMYSKVSPQHCYIVRRLQTYDCKHLNDQHRHTRERKWEKEREEKERKVEERHRLYSSLEKI